MPYDQADHVSNLTGISETLLIPLASRAKASRENIVRGFTDKKAETVCEDFSVDLERYAVDKSTVRGSVARSRWFDDHVLAFIEKYDNAVILSIGSGLNTMYERVSERTPKKGWCWIDTDLPDVVSLREQVFAEERNRSLQAFDATLPDFAGLKGLQGNEPLLVVSEAVLLYLEESLVDAFFKSLAEYAAPRSECTILFDYCSPAMIKGSDNHPAMKKLKSKNVAFTSSMKRPSHIKSYDARWYITDDSAAVMLRSGFLPALAQIVYQLCTFGRRIYGLAEAELR